MARNRNKRKARAVVAERQKNPVRESGRVDGDNELLASVVESMCARSERGPKTWKQVLLGLAMAGAFLAVVFGASLLAGCAQ